jgi:septal ring factor EnvC (AmiA/AmiB activator)
MFNRASTARWYLAALMCLFWIAALGLDVQPGLAKVYSWRDEKGQLHFTDNPANIPPHLRPESHELPPAPQPGGPTETRQAEEPSPPDSRAAPTSKPVAAPSPGQIASLERRASDLQKQIEAAQQERQQYLDKITAVRDVRTNPAFGRQRRRVDEWGRALAAVERRLNTLRQELEDVQGTLQQLEQARQPALRPPPPSEAVVFDAEGHTRDYWQQRAHPLRTQLQQAREQRKQILARLAEEPEGAFGRRGEEVLRMTRTLKETEATIRQTEAALQQLRQEAKAAGAPLEWLQE